MYSQAISSKPRTVIKGKMCLSSLKLSIQMPFFSFTMPLGSTLLTQFWYKCILRHHLFVYGGFSWCLFSFQDGCLETNSKTRRNKITFYWFENINEWREVHNAGALSKRWFKTRTNSLTAVRNDMPWERKWNFRSSKWTLGRFGEVSLR